MSKPRENVLSLQRGASVAFIRSSGGFAVQAPQGQKDPSRGWDPQNNSVEKSEKLLDQIETSDDNLGVHLHGNLVDVDVDGDDATHYLIPALDRFLPSCSHIWGRETRPKTHRAYVLRGMKDFNPADYPFLTRVKRIKEVKIEVRGGPKTRGEYSLLPGSVHPSGESYEWADVGKARSTPSMAPLSNILRGIRLAGATAVIAPYLTEGLRQDMTMALAGFLHKSATIAKSLDEKLFHLDEEASLSFLETLLSLADDDPADIYARKKAFSHTWAKAEKGKPVTGATTLGKLTGDESLVSKLYTLLADNPDIHAIDEFTSRFSIWQGPALVVDMELAAKGANKPLMTRPNFASSWGHKFIEVDGKRKLLAEILWHLSAATRVQGMTFVPGGTVIESTREGDKVNQWSGFQVAPWPSVVKAKDVKVFTDYLLEVVCSNNKEHYEWVLAWVADIFQNPSSKPGTALVLVGEQGAGKSILGHMVIGKIIGTAHYVPTNSVESMTKNFNMAFANKLLVQCDEALNNRQKAVSSKLKSIITDEVMMVEPKGVDAYHIPNLTRIMFTSNEREDAIYLSEGSSDRRYTVLEVSSSKKDLIEEYWDPFIEWVQNEKNLAKIHKFLLEVKYKRRLIQRPISSAAKIVMQQRSWEPFDAWLATMLVREHPLSEGTHQKWYDALLGRAQVIDRTGWPEWVRMEAMTLDYAMFCKRLQGNRYTDDLNSVQLGMSLKRLGIRSDNSSKQLIVEEFDVKLNSKVTKRIRLKKTPTMESIAEYLRSKYGFEAESYDDEEAVMHKMELSTEF